MLEDRLDDAVLVVAHPDDEILWFSSIIERVRTVLVCFLEAPGNPTWSRGRRRAADDYPLANTRFLGVAESMAFQSADWANPAETERGLAVSRRPGSLPEFDPEAYHRNFDRLQALLHDELAGHAAVITHNPWGEYGHEEHVQVYRAARSIAGAEGLPLWFGNYCSDRSYPLMLRHLPALRSAGDTRSTNVALARRIESLYRARDCWTWPFDDYPYFATETFFEDGRAAGRTGAVGSGATAPLNFIDLGERVGLTSTRPSPLRRAWRQWRRRTSV